MRALGGTRPWVVDTIELLLRTISVPSAPVALLRAGHAPRARDEAAASNQSIPANRGSLSGFGHGVCDVTKRRFAGDGWDSVY